MATALLESQAPGAFDGLAALPDGGEQPASIAAYYSLVFPGQTYYLQKLEVTIGRRLGPPGGGGDCSKGGEVDFDLGPLKSVSRLHAKITYDEDDERWVLDVYGRNGAWVDGVWAGPGSRVPLESRSQIQIAARSFTFILPPTEPPDDSPLTSSPTSTTRPRSPSLEATSLSPASSPGSAASPTPPDPDRTLEPEIVQRPKPKLIRKRAADDSDNSPSPPSAPPPEPKPAAAAAAPAPPEPTLPYAPITAAPPTPAPAPAPPKPSKPAKPKASKPAAKAPAAPRPAPALPPAPASVPAEPPAPAPLPPPPRPPPAPRLPGQPEPPKPAATLSQLCYRAITGLGGRATLQGILGWIMDMYEWYRIHEGEKWESSVRHNLSSNAAFVKSRRTSDEPGKGAFWTVDPAHIEAFEAAESRTAKAGGAAGSSKTVSRKEGAPKVKKEQPASAAPMPATQHAQPPFAKVGAKGPPPLMTSKPLASPFTSKPLMTTKPLASPFTSKPLPFKAAAAKGTAPVKQEAAAASVPPPVPPPVSIPAPYPPSAYPPVTVPPPVAGAPVPAPAAPQATTAPAVTPVVPPPATPAPVASSSTSSESHVPIVVGPLPASYVLAPGAEPPLIVLHEGTLVLAPKAFSNLSPDEIKEFEKLGPQKALEALQGHMVKFLKEQMRLRGRGRGRGRGGPGRGGGAGRGGAPATPAAASSPAPTPAAPSDTPMAVDDAASQARPRSNSAEAADVPPAKRARIEA